MLKEPRKTAAASSDDMFEFVDIYPTLSDLTGLELPGHLEGLSLSPLVDDPTMEWKDYVICKWFDGLTIKTRDYAYTEWSKSDAEVYARMLYNHQRDEGENFNISEDVDVQSLILDLKQTMQENRGEDFNQEIPGGKVREHVMF